MHLVKKLSRDLNSIKSKVDENNNTSSFSNRDSTSTNSSALENIKSILDIKIRNAFLNIIVEMFHDYNKYLCVLDDDVVFNTNALVENRPAQDSYFYKEYTEKTNRPVEGFVINYRDIISKYVRLKNGKLVEYSQEDHKGSAS